MGTTEDDGRYVISPEEKLQNELKSYGISPQDQRQNFSMLETASASHSDDGTKYEAAVLPYRPSTESDTDSVNFTDSLMVVGKQLPSGRAAAALDLFALRNIGLFVNYVATPYLTGGAVTNTNAAEAGNKYVAMFVIATFGYVLADTASDGMLVEFAQLHQASEQQQTQFHHQQGELEVIRMGVALRGELQSTEDENPAGSNVHVLTPREWKITARKLFHQRAIVQLMGYIFVSRVCFTYYATSAKAIYQYWAPAEPLTTNLFSSLNAAAYAGAALLIGHGSTMRIFQKLGWRQTVAGSVVVSAALTLVVALFTVYNVVRVGALMLLVEQVIVIFEAVTFFVALLAAVAVAEPGLESVGEHFDVYDSEYESDSSHARAQAMYCFLVAVVVRVLHLVVLPLLPNQAEAARALKLSRFTGRKGLILAIAAAVCASFMGFWALLTTTLSSFERTSCLNVAGGEGC
ncbi:hypothetical protein PF002_g7634 [Phytophthora fragariae]|uniref:Transmembrane protein n=1 Tax=Phytophthora fragariae TaxID=53985 RepID=A0A6A3ZUV3_9STRA|nr:hypothetical protein PF011_g6118 [Phytophthora fragariae]KAE9244703.1 hypothetical protein PF002_g7634 [Phytophthora fragariae]